MRIISYNVNGIRAAVKKGFEEWLATDPADIICLQEVKALETDLNLMVIRSLGYHVYWHSAQKKGYSGTAILSKFEADEVVIGSGHEQSDFEGRVISIILGARRIVNAYFPSGSSGEERQSYKYLWLDEFFQYVQQLKKEHQELIICGDYNICHKPIDIHNPVSNKKSSGFLPEEREWMDQWFQSGMVDTFRLMNEDPHHYSWWSYRANARNNNKGWRIDYISVTENLKGKVKDARIFPEVKHSDHCPVYLALED